MLTKGNPLCAVLCSGDVDAHEPSTDICHSPSVPRTIPSDTITVSSLHCALRLSLFFHNVYHKMLDERE